MAPTDLKSRPEVQVEHPEPQPIPGVKTLEPRQARFQRRLVLVVTVLPFLGFLAAAWTLWGTGLSVLDASIFLVGYCLTGLGVTVGFHRLFTHKSFEAKPALSAALAIAGSMAIQGPVIRWVSDHRRHHAFADQPGDPHSPHLDEGPGVKGVVKGLWHAHVGWFFDDEQTSARRWAPDLVKDPVMRRIDTLFPLWALISFGAPPVVGFLLTGTLQGAVTAFLWGSLARIFFLHHVTWSVNSICHFYGNRPFKTTDFSTNNWVLAIVSFGESWHNNHHAFPTSAVHGIGKGQVDLSAGLIRLLQKLSLVRDVKVASEKQLANKQA
ncbi:MAG TPA: acyl-CoA desaturase [Actinomycetota bacterium]|nr:acyl-CoA desaturase [Actinomycetota bacterium]